MCSPKVLAEAAHGLVLVEKRFYTTQKVSESILSLTAGFGRVLVGLSIYQSVYLFQGAQLAQKKGTAAIFLWRLGS